MSQYFFYLSRNCRISAGIDDACKTTSHNNNLDQIAHIHQVVSTTYN